MRVVTLKTKTVNSPRQTMVNVEMTAKDVKLFKEFQENYGNILAMSQGKVFEAKGCKVIMGIDSKGLVSNIDIHLRTFG